MDPVEGHDGTQLRLADDCSLPHPGLRWPYPRPHAGAVAGRGLAVAAAQAVAVLVPPAHLPPARHRDRAPRPAVGQPSDALCGQPRLLPRYRGARRAARSEEHTSELQSLMRISYAVFCLKTKNKETN